MIFSFVRLTLNLPAPSAARSLAVFRTDRWL